MSRPSPQRGSHCAVGRRWGAVRRRGQPLYLDLPAARPPHPAVGVQIQWHQYNPQERSSRRTAILCGSCSGYKSITCLPASPGGPRRVCRSHSRCGPCRLCAARGCESSPAGLSEPASVGPGAPGSAPGDSGRWRRGGGGGSRARPTPVEPLVQALQGQLLGQQG